MIVITGGAGMIGSIIAWHFNTKLNRDDLVIVDRITHGDQWQNLVKRQYAQYLDKDQLFDWLKDRNDIEAVIHMGAISATTERDFNKLVDANIHYSQQLWCWCASHKIPFFYASSAATYGAGEHGYNDTSLENLRPLNGYGYSKHFFDQWALRQSTENSPPNWAGFKFFNVYGPNEYHKGRMASVIWHSFNQVKKEGRVKLFKSHRPDFKDGQQLRDFIYVKDVLKVCYWLMLNRPASGIYNLGTGKARAFEDLVNATFAGLDKPALIDFIDMPEDIRDKYQYFTEADMNKLQGAGYKDPFYSLEAGVSDYVRQYLAKELYS